MKHVAYQIHMFQISSCTEVRVEKKFMPHNFFRKRACIEARDHGEPSRAVKSAGAAKRNKWRGPRACRGGGGRLCRLRVTLDRAARRGLFPRGERPALGTRRLPRQDRKALRKPGFPFRKVGSRRFGLEPRKLRSRLCGAGFPTDPPSYRMELNV